MFFKMKNSKIDVAVMLFSLLFFLGSIGIIFFMNKADKFTEEKIIEQRATLKDIEISNSNKVFAEIYTREYENSFLISTIVCGKINLNDLRSLKKGDTLFVGIKKENEKLANQVEFIDIVSLRTESQSIFSLDDYNKYMNESARPTRIASVVLASIFLYIFSYFLFKRMRARRKKGYEKC